MIEMLFMTPSNRFTGTAYGILLCVLLIAPILESCGRKEPAPTPASTAAPAVTDSKSTTGKYPVRSGIIQITSSLEGGLKQTIYFDEYGAKEATYTAVLIGDSVTSAVKINMDGIITAYNQQTRRGTRMKDPSGQFDMPDISAMSDEQKKEFHIQTLEDREYFGKQCKGYSMETMGTTSKAWMWGSLTMYAEAKTAKGLYITKVTDLQLDATIPPEKFIVPGDVVITEKK